MLKSKRLLLLVSLVILIVAFCFTGCVPDVVDVSEDESWTCAVCGYYGPPAEDGTCPACGALFEPAEDDTDMEEDMDEEMDEEVAE